MHSFLINNIYKIHTMKNIAKIITFLLLAIIISCKNGSKIENTVVFDRSDFETTQILNGIEIEFDSMIMQPKQLCVYDSILITYNPKEEKLFHIFNLNTLKKTGECISIGQGPTEMIQPYFVKTNKNEVVIFDMATSKISKYKLDEFINNPNPKPFNQTTLNEHIFSEISMIGNNIIGSPYQPGSQFYVFNMNGEKINELGSFPHSDLNQSETEKLDAFQSILATNYSDKFAACYIWTDLIEIYNIDGTLEKRIHGPENFETQFKEYNDGNIITSKSVKQTQRAAYYSPVSAGNELFILFNGKSANDTDYNIFSNQIFVFDWNGKPKQIFKLDQDVYPITVDARKKKIYGISNNPEYHVVEFSYK